MWYLPLKLRREIRLENLEAKCFFFECQQKEKEEEEATSQTKIII